MKLPTVALLALLLPGCLQSPVQPLEGESAHSRLGGTFEPIDDSLAIVMPTFDSVAVTYNAENVFVTVKGKPELASAWLAGKWDLDLRLHMEPAPSWLIVWIHHRGIEGIDPLSPQVLIELYDGGPRGWVFVEPTIQRGTWVLTFPRSLMAGDRPTEFGFNIYENAASEDIRTLLYGEGKATEIPAL